MDATARNLFALAASDGAMIPSRETTREALEETMKAIAAVVISLNFAHHRELGENNKGERRRSELGSPFRITLNNLMPPAGMYHTFLHLYAEHDGFMINTFTNDRFAETQLDLRIGADGHMQYGTFNRAGIPVQRGAVDTPARVQELVGQWMMRNFDNETRGRAQTWLPKVISQLRLKNPAGPGAWESPFDTGIQPRRLTA